LPAASIIDLAIQSGLCPQPNVVNAFFRMWREFGSKKAAAQAGLAFSNPDIHREAKFAPRLHRASLCATPEF
jgi:hypothetical protein